MIADLRAHLDRLDTALAAATPGPWAQHPADGAYVVGQVSEGEDGLEFLDVADTGGRGRDYPTQPEPDAALIVAAVNALPGLLAAVRAAADLADELEAPEEPQSHYHDGLIRGRRKAAEQLRTALAAADTPDCGIRSHRAAAR